VSPVDRQAADVAIRDFLRALGLDPGDPLLAGTPERVTSAFADDLLAGYAVDLGALVEDGSEPNPSESGDLVLIEDIAVATVCPHHLMPAMGTACVAYLPGRRLLGLGTVSRIVDACARRLALQERIGRDVVDVLMHRARAEGAYCELTLVHSCLSARGAHRERARVTTMACAGKLEQGPRRDELTAALARKGQRS
jgi:GTP cyclohydrolase I